MIWINNRRIRRLFCWISVKSPHGFVKLCYVGWAKRSQKPCWKRRVEKMQLRQPLRMSKVKGKANRWLGHDNTDGELKNERCIASMRSGPTNVQTSPHSPSYERLGSTKSQLSKSKLVNRVYSSVDRKTKVGGKVFSEPCTSRKIKKANKLGQ